MKKIKLHKCFELLKQYIFQLKYILKDLKIKTFFQHCIFDNI